jgi:hypothetical protein
MEDGRGAERVSYGVRFEQLRRHVLQQDGGSNLVSRGTTRDNIVGNLDMKWVGCRASRHWVTMRLVKRTVEIHLSC